MQIWIDLEANLGRFWEGFGGQVGSKLAPNGNKRDPTTDQKYDHFWEGLRKGFLKVFGPNLGPTWTILAPTVPQIPDLWGWLRGGCGRPLYPSPPKTPPRHPKTPPRPPQDTPRHPKNLTKTFKNASTTIPRACHNLIKMKYKYKKKKQRHFQNIQQKWNTKLQQKIMGNTYLCWLLGPSWPQEGAKSQK